MALNGFQRTIVMMILLSRNTFAAGHVSASGRRGSGALVEGRVRHLIRLHPRRALEHLLHRLEDGGIRATRTRLCVFFQIPLPDVTPVCSARGGERGFVLDG